MWDDLRSMRWWLLALCAAAFGIRLTFGLVVAPDLPNASDTDAYREMASHLAAGDGLSLRSSVVPGSAETEVKPTAKHPPLHPTVLAAGDLVGLDSKGAQRLLLATVSAVGVGTFAWGVAGLTDRRVGLLAGAIAAVDPLRFQYAGMLVSGATYLAVIGALVVVVAFAAERRTARSMLVLGAVGGLAVLARAEAALLVLFVVVPVAARMGRPRGRCVGAALAAAIVVVAPWAVRNVVVMGSPQISLNGGVTLAGANCPDTYDGESLGGWKLNCAFVAGAVALEGGARTEAEVDRATRRIATDHIAAHKRQIPKVVTARVGRSLGLSHRSHQLAFDVSEGRSRTWQRIGSDLRLALLPLAVIGGVVAYRRRLAGALLVAAGLGASAVLTSALFYGSTRMGMATLPAVSMLASLAVVAAFDRLREGTGRSAPDENPGAAA